MAAASYETVLEMAESLAADERLRLVEDLKRRVPVMNTKHSIMELRGLGKELWQDIDTTEYIRN